MSKGNYPVGNSHSIGVIDVIYGSSFFIEYLLIGAFTATAAMKVQQDVTEKLGLINPCQVRASFNRHNLFYRVEKKQNVETQVIEFLADHKNEPGIIYKGEVSFFCKQM